MVSHVFLLLALCAWQVFAVDSVVDLGYAKYRGAETAKGILQWAGMRYAQSPSRINGLRFVAPQDPLPVSGIQNATNFGPLCLGAGADLKTETGGKYSEDCLFANVFAPTSATAKSKLPVYIFIQGGGFNTNGNANYNGASLIQAAQGQIVVVNFNYRVGAYGFLASRDFTTNKTLSLNNGLKDQRQLMKWVKAHIEQFGGDPDHVTLGGASAGGGSVVLQMIAYGGRDDKLFHAALPESPATPPISTVEESQYQYDALLDLTSCKTFQCLQSLDAVAFQKAANALSAPFAGRKSQPLFYWNPTLDDDFIQDYEYNEFKNERFVKVPTLFGDATNEGTVFTPKSVDSEAKAFSFVADQFPLLNTKGVEKLEAVWAGPSDVKHDAGWRDVAANIYGHVRYQCPALNFTHAIAENGTIPIYQYRYDVGTALHVSELGPVWSNATNAAGVFLQSYWASFIRSYDPNKYPTTFFANGNKLTSPQWVQFGTGVGNRMLFADNNVVKIEQVTQQEWDRCHVVDSLGLQLNQTFAINGAGMGTQAGLGAQAGATVTDSAGVRLSALSSSTMLASWILVLVGVLQWFYV